MDTAISDCTVWLPGARPIAIHWKVAELLTLSWATVAVLTTTSSTRTRIAAAAGASRLKISDETSMWNVTGGRARACHDRRREQSPKYRSKHQWLGGYRYFHCPQMCPVQHTARSILRHGLRGDHERGGTDEEREMRANHLVPPDELITETGTVARTLRGSTPMAAGPVASWSRQPPWPRVPEWPGLPPARADRDRFARPRPGRPALTPRGRSAMPAGGSAATDR